MIRKKSHNTVKISAELGKKILNRAISSLKNSQMEKKLKWKS